MKSFLAASNGLYIQTINLPAGRYTFSAIVKSPNQMWAFAIEETGGWRTFEINLQTVQYRKVSIPFITAGVTKINIISGHASPTNIIELAAPMLNGGTMASQAKRHELDLNEVFSEAEIKVIELEKKTGAFAEPSINPAENTILAGSMLVGNSSGTNAGISGVGTSPTSARLWAGGTFADRSTANWAMRDDGVEEQWVTYNGQRKLVRRRGYQNGNYYDDLFNPADGYLAKRTAIINGFITEQWYNAGVLVYEIGKNGIYYVSEIPHSWNSYETRLIDSNSAATDSALITSLKAKLLFTEYRDTPFGDYASIDLADHTYWYGFNAGRNVESANNEQYEKFLYTNNNGGYPPTITTPTKLADGWYVNDFKEKTEDIPSGGGNANYSFVANFFRIYNGENVQGKALTISGTYYIHP